MLDSLGVLRISLWSGLGVCIGVHVPRALELDRELVRRFLGVAVGVALQDNVPGAVLPIIFM